ncbi:MAG: 23S rRNA (pseudouridine(1915)-N(3))-methyltransferase RlmH [Lentisphaerae bacterium]|jgi:23S rRNA (pseudouridine1915-N3)-methyltransferase|nr:23S rRNA (pseudouridine(1915)-N(3))-methyltransferase RlmH [Lentisphaerota bacterium]
MMLMKAIVVGKLKDKMMQSRCDEYAKWIGSYAKLEVRELADSTPEQEGQAIVRELDKDRNAYVVVLSEEGREFTTRQFAEHLGQLDRKVIFVIGGPYGHIPAVKQRANLLWSLSKLTFTHELARLLLFEQLFRTLNLNAGGHYHND